MHRLDACWQTDPGGLTPGSCLKDIDDGLSLVGPVLILGGTGQLGRMLAAHLISPEHLRLLKWDNIASPLSLTEMLGRQPAPIDAFLGDPNWYAAAENA